MVTDLTVEHFSAYYSGIRGTIPSTLGNCKRLQSLALAKSYLTGTLPTELASLSRLEELALHGNVELRGTVPLEYESLERLKIFSIYQTKVTNVPSGLCGSGKKTIYVDSQLSDNCPCCEQPSKDAVLGWQGHG